MTGSVSGFATRWWSCSRLDHEDRSSGATSLEHFRDDVDDHYLSLAWRSSWQKMISVVPAHSPI